MEYGIMTDLIMQEIEGGREDVKLPYKRRRALSSSAVVLQIVTIHPATTRRFAVIYRNYRYRKIRIL